VSAIVTSIVVVLFQVVTRQQRRAAGDLKKQKQSNLGRSVNFPYF